MVNKKFSDEDLKKACAESKSIREVMVNLGASRLSSSSHTHMSRRIRQLGIDTSHFRSPNSGLSHQGGKPKRSPDTILAAYPSEHLCPKAGLLRRALVEKGRAYQCEDCGLGPEWNGKPLVLQVDHISGSRADCTEKNLRFLCPNCHAQTETFGSRKIRVGGDNCHNGLHFIKMIGGLRRD